MYFFDCILIATVHCMFQTTRYGSKTYAQGLEQDSEWLSKFTMPQFSRKTMHSIETAQITAGNQSEIISAIAWEMWKHTEYPKSDEYTKVCKALVQKYPILQDIIGNGYVGIGRLI